MNAVVRLRGDTPLIARGVSPTDRSGSNCADFLFEADRNGDHSGICVNLCNVGELQTKGDF
ncbi:hypothetical protein GR157_03895 [Burkholderia sp. 4701]|nr:hypothetical protein [Burkholderia sp. 4701]MXN80993.1 hypothetical protein [Burkholderia sp. 4812]